MVKYTRMKKIVGKATVEWDLYELEPGEENPVEESQLDRIEKRLGALERT